MGTSKLSYSVIFILTACSFQIKGIFSAPPSNKNDINNYINSLNYNKDVVLAYKGVSVTGVKTEGQLDNTKKFIVINRERKSIYNANADIGVLTSNEHRTFPGALVLANYHLLDNSPDYVSIGRAPLKYTVNLPGMSTDGSFSIVPTFSNYQAAVNGVLKTWFEKYMKDHSVNAVFQSDYSFVYSKEQLRVKFGSSFKNTVVELNTDFSAVDKSEKLIMIQKFQQIFYTVSTASPQTPSDLFADEVTREELAGKFDDKNPPLLVDSVSYGRIIYVKIETASTDKEAKAILETKLTKLNNGIDSETDYSQQLKNFNMQVYVMGGGTNHIELVNAKNMKDVNDVIVQYSKFGPENLGYPISYATEFIKDNSRAVVKSTSEYTETTRTEHEKGIIKLKHTGWYVAQFKVEWDEVTYDNEGNKVTKRQSWGKNSKDLTAPFSTEIELAGNCENISVFAREATGIAWDWWRTVIDRSGISLIASRTFAIWGTTLNPSYSIDPPL